MASVLIFLICQDTRGHQAKPFVFFVNFALFWRFATLECYYAEKWWCIFALFHKNDCKSNKSQSEKALTVSHFFPVIQGPSCHCLDVHYYVLTAFYLSWLSLWHSTTEKDITAIPSQTSIIICLLWWQRHPESLWLDNSDDSNNVKKQGDEFS